MCRRLADELGDFWFRLFVDASWCSFRHGASPENYYVLRFFSLPERERRRFLTSGRTKKLDREISKYETKTDVSLLERKDRSDCFFVPYVHREFLFLKDCTEQQLSDFLRRHEKVVLKPVASSMGKGLQVLYSADIKNISEYIKKGRERQLLLEEFVVQCQELAALHPESVNTVRVNAARNRDGRITLIGACLKCGRGEAAVDNFHAGGIAWPLDLQTGRVCGPGRDNRSLQEYEYHPDSAVRMMGFSVPYWQEVLRCVLSCMDQVPSLGYVGWDIAVTGEGPELVEGNVHWPGGNIIQFDNIGKYPLLKESVR